LRSGQPGEAQISQAEEAGLVQSAKSGDAQAFGRLYDASVDRIYRYIFFRVTDADLAEDLTAAVFLKAWEGLARYRPDGPFLAWLYTIARNTVIDHYRTRRKSVSLDQAVIRQDPGFDAKVDLQDEVDTLKRSMLGLTDEQREVLTLRFIADMETAEIAERMKKSEGAIRALQMRALQALAKVMNTERRET